MLDRKIMIPAILLIIIFALSAVSASENVTEDIASTDENSEIILEEPVPGTFDDLSDEIANAGDTLELDKNYKYQNGSTDGIIINKSITIDGKGHSIDGDGKSRIFSAFNASITLNNLTLINGFADMGGAIFVNSTITCNNVTFINNHAKQGGSIYTMHGVSLYDCTFEGGSADEGAAIYAHQIPLAGDSQTPELPDDDGNGTDGDYDGNGTDDEGNGTDGDYDGDGSMDGMDSIDPEDYDFPAPRDDSISPEIDFNDFDYSNPFCLISGCTFMNFRDVPFSVLFIKEEQRITIVNSRFINSTSDYATAIYTLAASNNFTNVTFENLHAGRSGGAIGFNTFVMINIENATFTNVTADNCGGAISADGQGWLSGVKAELVIRHSQFKNSKAKYGAALALFGTNLYLEDVTFKDNAASGNGVIYAAQSGAEIVNCTFENNTLDAPTDTDEAMMYLFSSVLKMRDTTLLDNTKGIFALKSIYNITHTTFKGNGIAIYSAATISKLLEENIYSGDEVVENASADEFYVFVVNTTGVDIKLISNDLKVSSLPKYFNSDDWGWVSPVKNQGISGGCWVFGTCAALESALLKATGIEYNLSEQNIQKNMLQYGKYGMSWLVEGGFPYLTSHYMISWYGPLPVEYDLFDIVGKATVPIISSNAIHIQDVLWLDFTTNQTDNDQIKWTVLKYGAATAEMLSDYDSIYFNKNTSASYHNNTGGVSHVVCVVGWDDDYPAENFQITPPGNGAWILKNSYGEESFDEGYIYISYYDTIFNLDCTEVAFILENTENYTKNYQTDIGGDIKINNMSKNYEYKNTYVAIEDDF